MADANNITLNDANGVPHLFATVYDLSSNTHRSHINLADPFTVSNKATVTAFHSTDNQQPGGNAFGLLTGGVAQHLNALGNLDRQRETSVDNIPALGIATGTAQLASPQLVTTVTSGAITGNTTAGNTQFVNCTTSFTQRANIVQTISNGSILLADGTGANAEFIYVFAANSTGVNAQFMKSHGTSIVLQGFSYSQARDSAGPDGMTPVGLPSGTVWLWNGAANSGIGGVEIERSAAGELDGASGNGTNIAAEYEWNGGGPANSSGKATGFQFDRARSVQGKANVNFTITTTTAAMANITFTAAANTNLLQPGQKVTLSGNATSGAETVLISATFVPGSGNSALLQSPVVNPGQTTAQWDVYNVIGPGILGFYPDGVGIEEEALYDPLSNLYYIERSATQDNVSPKNVVMESPALLNAAGNMDRMRNNLDSTANLVTITAATTAASANQTNFNHRGVLVYVNITANTTAANTTVTINNIDPVSGKFFPIFTSANIVGVATGAFQIYPGIAVTAGNTASAVLSRTWSANLTSSGTITGQVTATLIL